MNKIACVVVTYNRLELLKRCIEGLRNQSMSDFDIYVVNNGSTDGTKAWLDNQADITAIHQDNIGGAGGFHKGMEIAYKNGYEWIWLMDDDGIADSRQLEELYANSLENNILFSNALVCNIENHGELSFGLPLLGNVIYNTKEAQKVLLVEAINPFNGTFISRRVIDTIGLIKKEMFIWGDETEYTFRAHQHGIRTVTITTAIQYHPKIKGVILNVFPFWEKYSVNVKPENLSHIYYRNLGYIYKTYMPNKLFNLLILYTILFIRLFNFKELRKFYKYYFKGAKGIF